MADLGIAAPEAEENPETVSDGGEEVPQIPGPRSFVILQDDGSFDLSYTQLGTLTWTLWRVRKCVKWPPLLS